MSPHRRNNKIWLWALAILAFTIGLVAIGCLLGYKWSIERHHSDNPYTTLKDYNPEPETVTKGTFEKVLARGDEVFDWLMKNRYFEETQGDSVHPRMLTREEKENLENKYSSEYSVIIAILQQANSSRHRFVVKSAELSNEMTARALGALKKKNIKEAIEDCKTAIDIFPLNAKPYILLTKFYLMTGQEQKMFETLTLAGHSYPNFDSIVGIINDGDLEKMPLDAPQDNIFLANFPENKKTAISFIFDDGEKNVYTNAVPVFEKNGFRATFAVIAGMVAATDDDLFWGSWSEWKDAADRGFEIANHSMYHRNASELHGSDFDIAIDQSKALIEKNIGHQVTAYIFPYDGYNDEAVSRALREHKVVRSWELLRACYNRTVGITYGGPNFSVDTANRLVDIGIKRQLWLVANCHGVTTKRGILSFKSMTPDFLEKHLAYIHDRSNDVWVDTFSNVFAYLSQRAQTTIEIKGFTVGWAEFILHNANAQIKLSCPITVVLKTPQGVKIKSVHTSDDHMLKAWVCAADKLCVDADLYDEDIRVQWE